MLLYYKNMDSRETYSYDYSNQNWHGPVDAYQYLPSTSEWNNFGLIPPGTRQIVSPSSEKILLLIIEYSLLMLSLLILFMSTKYIRRATVTLLNIFLFNRLPNRLI